MPKEMVLICCGPDKSEAFEWPKIGTGREGVDHYDALRLSILSLWTEATRCGELGLYEACILACGAVIERCLKLEYEIRHGASLTGRWTLGRCVYELNWEGILEPEILELAKRVISPRNERTHALLEHCDPYLACVGETLPATHRSRSEQALIEGYQEEAREILASTFEILRNLYATPQHEA